MCAIHIAQLVADFFLSNHRLLNIKKCTDTVGFENFMDTCVKKSFFDSSLWTKSKRKSATIG